MVISPAVIESEEVIRQVVPAKMGFSDISAGNLIGIVLYFTCPQRPNPPRRRSPVKEDSCH